MMFDHLFNFFQIFYRKTLFLALNCVLAGVQFFSEVNRIINFLTDQLWEKITLIH